jgi:hypothetical protein
MNKFIVIGLVCISLGMASCQDQYDICDQNKSVNFKGIFYKNTGGIVAESPVPFLTINPINTTATIYNQQPNISSFVFALNPTQDSAKYVFKIDNSGLKDTVTIYYTSQQKNLSPECGDIITHTLSNASTTSHNLDSVKIINNKVDNIESNNLRLYY